MSSIAPMNVLLLEGPDTPAPLWPELKEWMGRNSAEADVVRSRDACLDARSLEFAAAPHPWTSLPIEKSEDLDCFLRRFSVVIIRSRLTGPLRCSYSSLLKCVHDNFVDGGHSAPPQALHRSLLQSCFDVGSHAFAGLGFLHARAPALSFANLILVITESSDPMGEDAWPVETELLAPFRAQPEAGRLPPVVLLPGGGGIEAVTPYLDFALALHRCGVSDAFDLIHWMVQCRERRVFVITGPAGTGKKSLGRALVAGTLQLAGSPLQPGIAVQLAQLEPQSGRVVRIGSDYITECSGMPRKNIRPATRGGPEVWFCPDWQGPGLEQLLTALRAEGWPHANKDLPVSVIVTTDHARPGTISRVLPGEADAGGRMQIALPHPRGEAARRSAVRLATGRRIRDGQAWLWEDRSIDAYMETAISYAWTGIRDLKLAMIDAEQKAAGDHIVRKFNSVSSVTKSIYRVRTPQEVYQTTLSEIIRLWNGPECAQLRDRLPLPQTSNWHNKVSGPQGLIKTVEQLKEYTGFMAAARRKQVLGSESKDLVAASWAAIDHFFDGVEYGNPGTCDHKRINNRFRQRLVALEKMIPRLK